MEREAEPLIGIPIQNEMVSGFTNKWVNVPSHRNSTPPGMRGQRNCLRERFSLGSLGVLWASYTELLGQGYASVGERARCTSKVAGFTQWGNT